MRKKICKHFKNKYLLPTNAKGRASEKKNINKKVIVNAWSVRNFRTVKNERSR
jgi:hypothetical protein